MQRGELGVHGEQGNPSARNVVQTQITSNTQSLCRFVHPGCIAPGGSERGSMSVGRGRKP